MSIYEQIRMQKTPRVHIEYEVETEGGVEKRELPFVVGVLGDYMGNHSAGEIKPLKERDFININQDNFTAVMTKLKPGLRFSVKNRLSEQEEELKVQLQFTCMEDFQPEKIVEQVPVLKSLLDARNQLVELASKAECSEALEELLTETLQSQEKITTLANSLASLNK
ncbi:MAG: type VI secretion system contractile sheath small subunit [Pseudomonadota bacterium]